jgi:hypothetical protein
MSLSRSAGFCFVVIVLIRLCSEKLPLAAGGDRTDQTDRTDPTDQSDEPDRRQPLTPVEPGTADHRDPDFAGAGRQQGPSAFPRRRAGGHHIVDQQHFLAGQGRAHREGTFQIQPPLHSLETLLGRGRPKPHQQTAGNRFPPPSTQHPGEQQRLIVSSLSQPGKVQRDRHYQVGQKILAGGFKNRGQQAPEWAGEGEIAPVFELVHRLAEAVLVKADTADFHKGRGFQDASLAKVIMTFFGGIGQLTAGTMGRRKGTHALQA